MEMNAPVGATPLDGHPDAIVGRPLPRVEGPLKVSGRATYAAEYAGQGECAYGVLVPSAVARGTITGFDVGRAMAVPGVLRVLTFRDVQSMPARHGHMLSPLGNDRVDHVGQPVALAIAATFEAATEAAALVRVEIAAEPIRTEMRADLARAITPSGGGAPADSHTGDFAPAFAAAPVRIDVTYTTAAETHAMMEPHATIASWDGGELTLMTANQMPVQSRANIARTLGLDVDKVRLVSRYIGGGFGSKLFAWPDAVLAALGARAIGKPVKVVLTRPQIFGATGHRTDTIQRLRIGAGTDGRIVAIGHDSFSNNNPTQDGFEGASDVTRSLYAGANRETRQRLVHLDLPISTSMRAPGEAVGLLALEGAMDELAEACGLDPIELRVRNEPAVDPQNGKPFSSRHLLACYKAGAERFGWERRNPRPGQVRDGRFLVGMGIGVASRGNLLRPASAKVALRSDGHAVVWLAMTDIGTGSYTILTQIAAEMLGLPVERVTVLMGDTSFPPTDGSGGSWGASSSGSAVYEACLALRGKLAGRAGLEAGSARFEDGRIAAGGVSRPIAELVPPGGSLDAMGEIAPGSLEHSYEQRSFGAQFAEVGVDVDTGEIRVRRMLGVFTAGRILNAATARSQCLGGMTMGIGAALTESLAVDPRNGAIMNDNLAEYLVPVHADIPALDVLFLPELDPIASPIKSKGLGELGICGAGAAVQNAVYNATGVRVRDYPITIDKIMPHLAAV